MTAGIWHAWEPIRDLPEDWSDLSVAELDALGSVWSEQKKTLHGSDGLRQFTERLHREWAIETGIIERVYSLDLGVTVLLIEHGIDADLIPRSATDKDPDLVARIIQDQHDAIDFLFDLVGRERALSLSFVRELHALMTRHQTTVSGRDQFGNEVEVPLLHGEWKRWPNNPTRADGLIHEYAPPEQVASEMERLVELHARHDARGVPAEVEAAWLHHRFTQIHPFQDGNGRVARALASLVLIRAQWFPLVVTREDRGSYIDALETADRGDLGPLVRYFAALERKAFLGAVGVAREVLADSRRLDQVLDAIAERFSSRDQKLRTEWEQARQTAQIVLEAATAKLENVRARLAHASVKSYVDAVGDDGEHRHWYRWQAIEAARRLDFFANWREFSAWARLRLVNESQAFVLIAFTSVGREFRGVIGATVTYFRREALEEGQREIVDVTVTSDEVFQINYEEPQESVLQRFGPWLDRSLARALTIWEQSDLGG